MKAFLCFIAVMAVAAAIPTPDNRQKRGIYGEPGGLGLPVYNTLPLAPAPVLSPSLYSVPLYNTAPVYSAPLYNTAPVYSSPLVYKSYTPTVYSSGLYGSSLYGSNLYGSSLYGSGLYRTSSPLILNAPVRYAAGW